MATGTRGRCTAACVRSSASTTSTHSLRAATNGLVRAHDGGGVAGLLLAAALGADGGRVLAKRRDRAKAARAGAHGRRR
eukprot:CAMPEP_0202111556 /NCGR_PEP_ID=MMETSP0965-20130614/29485_1 /ASSEMBLY_ACC=CAM_ASM_000507 /TAXON_ID=4773 /ORGANISM="Schizochytrium aggregatum, Strain ATCC28209" /LENGTH=78 /DNA_ID=CAMNT_0048681055 /DNA_START=32 /DNA_END=263 /DNA_ORIENTATION=+